MSLHRTCRNGRCKYKTVLVDHPSVSMPLSAHHGRLFQLGLSEPIAICPIEADLHEPDAYVVPIRTESKHSGADTSSDSVHSAFPRTCESLGVQEFCRHYIARLA